MADRDYARSEFGGKKMNTNQMLAWIVEEMRQQRPLRNYIAENHKMLQCVLHILKHANPNLPPEQLAAIEAATQQIDSSTNLLKDSVERNKETKA